MPENEKRLEENPPPNRTSWRVDKWELLVVTRLFSISLFLVFPVIYGALSLHYLSPIGLVILGFSLILVVKFVLFEPRESSPRFLNRSLVFLVICSVLIALNFVLGLIICIIHNMGLGILLNASVCLGSAVYFLLVTKTTPFEKINRKLVTLKRNWYTKSSLKSPRRALIKKNLFGVLATAWLGGSLLLLAIPYPLATQEPPAPDQGLNGRRLGFWTGGAPINPLNNASSQYFDDETMALLGNAGGYLVYGCRQEIADDEFVAILNRCREFNVEVHLYRCPLTPGDSFMNIWTAEKLIAETESVLAFLSASGWLHDPVTTVVYDMEGLPRELHFPLYGGDPEIIAKLQEYYAIQGMFVEYNEHLRADYGLDVRICTDYSQKWDAKDGDDDLAVLYGIMGDGQANWSYMAYRRDNLGFNFLTDHFRLLDDGDTIILNSWKYENYQCYGDLDCLIEECRLVLGYPDKKFNLEFWALRNFLPSYGVEGFRALLSALTEDPSGWPAISITNRWPYWPFWDLVMVEFSLLDLYGPVFRLVFWGF